MRSYWHWQFLGYLIPILNPGHCCKDYPQVKDTPCLCSCCNDEPNGKSSFLAVISMWRSYITWRRLFILLLSRAPPLCQWNKKQVSYLWRQHVKHSWVTGVSLPIAVGYTAPMADQPEVKLDFSGCCLRVSSSSWIVARRNWALLSQEQTQLQLEASCCTLREDLFPLCWGLARYLASPKQLTKCDCSCFNSLGL